MRAPLDVLKERPLLWTVDVPEAEIILIRRAHFGHCSPLTKVTQCVSDSPQRVN